MNERGTVSVAQSGVEDIFSFDVNEEVILDSALHAFDTDIFNDFNIKTTWKRQEKKQRQSAKTQEKNTNTNTTNANTDRFIPIRDDQKVLQKQAFCMPIKRNPHNNNNNNHNPSHLSQEKYGKQSNMHRMQNDENCDNHSNSNRSNRGNTGTNSNTHTHTNTNTHTHANKTQLKTEFEECLKSSLLHKNNHANPSNINEKNETKILTFREKAPKTCNSYISHLSVMYTQQQCHDSLGLGNDIVNMHNHNDLRSSSGSSHHSSSALRKRYISPSAERVLDAPELADDYYLNLLDWSSLNLVAIGLGSSLYLWNSDNGEISLLFENADNIAITAVQWTTNGTHIAVGTNDGLITLWDAAKQKCLRKMHGHSLRVGCLSWNNCILSSGSKDSTIINSDVRKKQHQVSVFADVHEQEVCGLEWNAAGTYLCSGSNDNKTCVWQLQQKKSLLYEFYECNSAVKAIDWCPWNHNLFAIGGGSSDKCIRIYDISIGTCIQTTNTQSQICSLLWNPFDREILSAHGHGLNANQLCLWKYPSMIKTHQLSGHTSRILHTTLSPNKEIVCTAAADETLRFWRIFENTSKSAKMTSNAARNRSTNNSDKNSSLNFRIR